MNITIYLFILIELIGVSIYDFYTKKIPNKIIVLNLVFFILFSVVGSKGFDQFNLKQIIMPLSFIIIGFYLFKLNIMGAGDSKLLATIFLFVPIKLQTPYLNYLLYSTLLIGGSFFTINFFSNIFKILKSIKERNILFLKGIWGSKFPFAPVIILSWMWFGWNLYLKK